MLEQEWKMLAVSLTGVNTKDTAVNSTTDKTVGAHHQQRHSKNNEWIDYTTAYSDRNIYPIRKPSGGKLCSAPTNAKSKRRLMSAKHMEFVTSKRLDDHVY